MEDYTSSNDNVLIQQLQGTAQGMSVWLKLLGILYIVMGVPTAIVLVGILYIWLGLLLYRAGDAATQAGPQGLVTMMENFKTYFTVMGILAILGVIIFVIYIVVIVFVIGVVLNESGLEI